MNTRVWKKRRNEYWVLISFSAKIVEYLRKTNYYLISYYYSIRLISDSMYSLIN